MDLITFRLDSFHDVFVCASTGAGLLVKPHPADDVVLDGVSLQATATREVLARLFRSGWDLGRDQDGAALPAVGTTFEGRSAHRLCASFVEEEPASLAAFGDCGARLADAAGVQLGSSSSPARSHRNR